MAFIEVRDLKKTYVSSDNQVQILKGINLDINKGEFVSLMGPSGAGKSTFLQLLGALDRPTEGEIQIENRRISTMTDKDLTLFRRRHLGFIFQFFNLMPTLSVLENVALPCLLDGQKLSGIKRLEKNSAVFGQLVMWAEYLSTPAQGELFTPRYPFLEFDRLEEFEIDVGIDDSIWLRNEDKETTQLLEDDINDLPLFQWSNED